METGGRDTQSDVDVIVVGGGIVGLASAWTLSGLYPDLRILLLEKESSVAQHQTGRNSGVLHSGIYYRPGSLKATHCRLGKESMVAFCDSEGLPYEICGKIIVATSPDEAVALEGLAERGRANQIACSLLTREQLQELEPHCAGERAIHVPGAGIVDYIAVCERLAARLVERGHTLLYNTSVTGLRETEREVVVSSTRAAFTGRYVINCTGLQSDRVTALCGDAPAIRIVPFRGEYFTLSPDARRLCRNLIYPTPDPRFPFLGVHFTRLTSGEVECGPNAVLALAREGYHKTDINLRDIADMLGHAGFRRLARRHWRMGLAEMWRSYSRSAFARALQRLVPEITQKDLSPAPAGVRAMAIALDGSLVDDFAFADRPRVLHVINAPSPAATAALSLARVIVERLAARFS